MEENIKMVAVATASQPMEATLIQVELGSCGIDSNLDGEFTVAANPLLSNAVGGIRIVVSAEDAKHASAVLANYYKQKRETDAALEKTCPKCKNENGRTVRQPNWVGILSVITVGAFSLFYPWPKYRCPDCNHKWR
jgi:hypothetical protein